MDSRRRPRYARVHLTSPPSSLELAEAPESERLAVFADCSGTPPRLLPPAEERVTLWNVPLPAPAAAALADELGRDGSACATLILTENALGCAGASLLAKTLRRLRWLELTDNAIGDAGAGAVAAAIADRACSLCWLGLADNRIGDAGAAALARALAHNAALEALDLQSNKLGDGAAAALADALRVNLTLQWLDLQMNEIDTAGVVALRSALEAQVASPRRGCGLQQLHLWDNAYNAPGRTDWADPAVAAEARGEEVELAIAEARKHTHCSHRACALNGRARPPSCR
mmetsp:Transcript_26596/g.86990  ORF Transcript_26596/g.86990 Transcript_26596/m.86990 type:complete len:287 (-) Transcript_26596:523-1383(-)